MGSSNAARPPVKKPARPAPTRETTNTNQVGRRNVLRALTDEEKAHRLKALELSKIREEQAQILMKEEQQRKERADEEEKNPVSRGKRARGHRRTSARPRSAFSPSCAPQEEATAPEAPAQTLKRPNKVQRRARQLKQKQNPKRPRNLPLHTLLKSKKKPRLQVRAMILSLHA